MSTPRTVPPPLDKDALRRQGFTRDEIAALEHIAQDGVLREFMGKRAVLRLRLVRWLILKGRLHERVS